MAGRRMNFVLAELGWIEKLQKGWIPTEQGKAVGAVRKELDKPGDPEVLWPGTILNNKVLLSTIKCLVGEVEVPTPRAASGTEESAAKLHGEPSRRGRALGALQRRTADR